MALVTVDYLRALPGFAAASTETLEALIGQASALVVDYAAPYLDDATPATCPEAVQVVVSQMVRRGLANPRGAAQETLGDYSYTMGSDGGIATLYMTKREQRIVRRAVGKLGAGSVALTGDLPVQPSECDRGGVWDAVVAGLD